MFTHTLQAPGRSRARASGSDEWDNPAACRVNPELFFPLIDNPSPYRDDHQISYAQVQDAKAMCGECPLLAACRRDALTSSSEYGVQAGMTPAERRRARTRQELGVAA